MEVKDKLSVVLPLKGRKVFSKRWLEYHSKIGMPWKIYISDADQNSEIPDMIRPYMDKNGLFIEYSAPDIHQSDNEQGHVLLFKRLLYLLKKVDSPYVIFAHNDDFILPSGVKESIRFLENNKDYVSCGGAFLGINAINRKFHVCREAYSYDWTGLKFIYPPLVIDHCSPLDRFIFLIQNYSPTWFSVHRTKELSECFQAAIDLEISDALVIEIFQALYMNVQGKTYQDYFCATYLRQLDNSMVSGSMSDIFDRVFKGTQVKDLQNTCALVSKLIAETGFQKQEEVRRIVMENLIDRERRSVLSSGNFDLIMESKKKASAWIYTLRSLFPALHKKLQRMEVDKIIKIISTHENNDTKTCEKLENELNEIFLLLSAAQV